MNSYLDIAIVVVFLALNIIVGLRYGKGVKSIKDYALGGRNFSTGALVSTIVATWIGGGTFFMTISKTYSDGLYYILASLGIALSLFLTAFILIPRMSGFLGKTSVAELMGELYGKEVRIIIALSATIGASGFIAIQFKALGNIFGYFLGVENYIVVIIAGIIVTTYSSFGGIRAVTFTDVLQFITFGVTMPLIGIIIWKHINHPDFSFANALTDPKFDFKAVLNFGNPRFWEMIPLMFYFAIPELEPVFCQRISIGKNIEQVKKAFLISGVFLILIQLIIAWIPFLIYNTNPNLDTKDLLGYIIDNYSYPGFKGLIIIGVTALAMSTADSYINISSVLFTNDLCKPLNIGGSRELVISRIFAILLGAGSILLALKETDLLSILLAASSLYMPVATIPILLTILGFRTSTKSILIGMSAGITTVIIWNMLNIETDCIIFAVLVNLIFLLGSHYLLKQPGGWIATKKPENIFFTSPREKGYYERLSILIKEFSFIEFCKKTAPTNELAYTSFGVYCFFYTIATMYSTAPDLINDTSNNILVIYQIMMVTSVVVAMYPIWPAKIKYQIFMQVAWNPIIFYMLIFFSSFFALVNNDSSLQLVAFTVNLIITAILSGWRIATPMIVIGCYLSTQFYEGSLRLERLSFEIGSSQAILVYTLFVVSAVIVIFLKPEQQYQELTEEKVDHLSETLEYREDELTKALSLKDEFIRNISHEYHAPMTGIISTAQTLWEKYDALPDALRKSAAENIYRSMIRLESFDANINNLAKLASPEYELNKQEANLSRLLEDRINVCLKLHISEKDRDNRTFTIYIEPDIMTRYDEYFIAKTLDNLILNSILYCKMGSIKISLAKITDDTQVEFKIIDEGIGIIKGDILKIFEAFTVGSKVYNPAGGRGIGLALCKKVMEMHGGTIKAESDGVKGATFSFYLPMTNINQV